MNSKIHRASLLPLGGDAVGRRGLLLFLLVFLLCACRDEVEPVPFSLSDTEVCFDADGGTATLSLSAAEDWMVTTDCEWCMVTPSNGRGSVVCELRVDSSYLYKERVAHLNFHCGARTYQVTVSQLGYEKVILLDKTEIEVPDYADYESMFEEIDVKSNVDYEVWVEYADPAHTDWLTASKVQTGKLASIPRMGKVRIDYQMYLASDQDREATVVFRQTNAKEGETPVESRLVVRQKKAQEIVPSREGDSLALLALSRIMHLNVSWDASQSMIYWANVKLEDRSYYNEKLQRQVTEPRVVYASFTMFETNEGIPYHIRYLDQLEELNFIANGNAHLKRIDLGEHVTYLEHLKYLTLLGCGISTLPERMKEMNSLEELDLSGNNLEKIPVDLILALDKKNLKYINLANNRRRDVFGNLYANRNVRDTLGLHGALPEALLTLQQVRYLGLSYNYLEGAIPDMGYDASAYSTLEEKINHNPVMPQLEQLSLNLNFFTGKLPDWVLYHRNLRCWDPYTLVFNQYERSKDSNGRPTGFDNEPSSVEQVCHLWDEEQPVFLFNRQNTFDATFKYQNRMSIVTR